MYWNGAELDGLYPVSIPTNGLALNITVTTTAGHLNVGLVGARGQLPHLQHLSTYLDTALDQLATLTPPTAS